MTELQITALSPENSEQVCSALRTWAPVLTDFYRSVTDSGGPPDLASQATVAFFENVIAAAFARPDYDELD